MFHDRLNCCVVMLVPYWYRVMLFPIIHSDVNSKFMLHCIIQYYFCLWLCMGARNLVSVIKGRTWGVCEQGPGKNICTDEK
jgi:hypothetical protein